MSLVGLSIIDLLSGRDRARAQLAGLASKFGNNDSDVLCDDVTGPKICPSESIPHDNGYQINPSPDAPLQKGRRLALHMRQIPPSNAHPSSPGDPHTQHVDNVGKHFQSASPTPSECPSLTDSVSSAAESEEDEAHGGIPLAQTAVPSSPPRRKGRLRLRTPGPGDPFSPEATTETTENQTVAGGHASPRGSRRLRIRKRPQDGGSSDDDVSSHNGCGDNHGGRGEDGDGRDDREDSDGNRFPWQFNMRKKQKPREKNINLSCPFRKRNPLKFNIRDHGSCSLRGYRDFPHLMDHLKNDHTLPCESDECQLWNSTDPDPESAPNPAEAAGDQSEGMNGPLLPEGVIDNSMIDRIVNGQCQDDAEEKWHTLWDMLFPNVVVPAKGFVAPVELDEVRAQFQDSLDALKGRIRLAVEKSSDQIGDRIATVISQDMELLVRDFISEVFQVCEVRSSRNILAGPNYLRRCLGRNNAIAMQSIRGKSPNPDRQGGQISAMVPLQPRIPAGRSPVDLPHQWSSLPYPMGIDDQDLPFSSVSLEEIPLCGDHGNSTSWQMELDLRQLDEPEASSVGAFTPASEEEAAGERRTFRDATSPACSMHSSSDEPTENEEYGSDENGNGDDDVEDIVSKVCDIVISHCGDTQEVGFDAITQTVKSTTEFILRLMNDLTSLQASSGFTQHGSTGGRPSGSGIGAPDSSGGSPGGSGGGSEAGDGKDRRGSDGANGSGGPPSPGNGSETSGESRGWKGSDYSCPFRKRNPDRFNPIDFHCCATTAWKSFPLLKRHVRMSHKQPRQNPHFHHFCQRCKEGFLTEALLTDHLKGEICQFVDLKSQEPTEPEDGITPEVDRLLSARDKSTQVMTWQSLWRLLFPQDENIPSPEFVPPDEVEEIRRSFHHHERDLEQRLEDTLRTAMSTGGSNILQSITRGSINIFRDHVNIRLSACKGRREKILRGKATRRTYRTVPRLRKSKGYGSERGDGLTSTENAKPQGPSTRRLAPIPRSNEGSSSISPLQTSKDIFQASLANQTDGPAPLKINPPHQSTGPRHTLSQGYNSL